MVFFHILLSGSLEWLGLCISWIKRAGEPWRGCMRTECYMITLASALASRGLWEGVWRFSHSVYAMECSTLQLVLASSPSTPVLNWPALHSKPPRDEERGEIKRARKITLYTEPELSRDKTSYKQKEREREKGRIGISWTPIRWILLIQIEWYEICEYVYCIMGYSCILHILHAFRKRLEYLTNVKFLLFLQYAAHYVRFLYTLNTCMTNLLKRAVCNKAHSTKYCIPQCNASKLPRNKAFYTRLY